MARKCSVCTHPKRDVIDNAIVAGTSYRDIAGRFGLSRSAVERHANGHLPAALVKAREAGEVIHADDLLARVRSLEGKALRILEEAEKTKDHRIALGALKETRGCIELLARMLCELDRQKRERSSEGAFGDLEELTDDELRAIIAGSEASHPLVIVTGKPPGDYSDCELRDKLIYELSFLSDDSLQAVFNGVQGILCKKRSLRSERLVVPPSLVESAKSH